MTEPGIHDVLEPALPSGRLASLAARLGCTEGQLYSMAIAITASSALVIGGGVPLGDHPQVEAAPGAPAPQVLVAPQPSGAPVTPLPPIGTGTAIVPDLPVVAGPGTAGPFASEHPVVRGPQPSSTDLRVPEPGLPRALVADALHVFAGTDNGGDTPSRFVAFSRTGGTSRVFTVSGQPQDRTGGLSAAALHGTSVLVTDRSRGALLEIDPRSGSQRVLTSLPDLPACVIGVAGTCQPGAQDLPASPEGLVVAGRYAYVADAAQGTIWRYDLHARTLAAWYTSSDFSAGGPSGLALDGNGDLVFTVVQTADPAALLRGALYRLEIAEDGTPGARALLASFAAEDGVGPVTVGRSGVYVGLRGKGGVVMVKPDGATSLVATPVRVPAPGGLSLVEGILYVADAGKAATAMSGVVRAVTVPDGPGT